MEWIAWDAELELGHAAMDADHKRLLGLVNSLADDLVNHAGRTTYERFLDELLVHAQAHFRMEEDLMALHGYPRADEHKSTHVALIRSAREFRNNFDPATVPSVSLLYFFEQWLTRHIATADRELAEFITSAM